MSNKYWIDRVIKKPAKVEDEGPHATTGKRATLAEALLKMRKEKG